MNEPVSSLASLSLARDKTKTSDRIDVKYVVWAIYIYIYIYIYMKIRGTE